ncbi:MAG: ATP-binding cassette domain-containing protein, partial [Zetaproteobacteria bacterium]
MLEIKNLHVKIGGREILKGVNLTVRAGEVHSIMGPNGSGKSTLAQVLAGRESYEITEGEILYRGKNLAEMSPEERAGERWTEGRPPGARVLGAGRLQPGQVVAVLAVQ